MTRPRPNRLRKPPVAGRIEKSLPAAVMANTTGQIRTATDLAVLQQGQSYGGAVEALPRARWDSAFGPGMPLIPAALDPVRRDSGRPEPRISEYPVSWNLPGTRGSHVPWRILRDAAELPILSDCIRYRKDQVATLEWEIGISRQAIASVQRDTPGASRRGAEATLREQLRPEMVRLRQFWEEPDPINQLAFPLWITQLLDERLVLDAVAIWPRRNLRGDVIGFALLDGSTIKPLLDDHGGRPAPPYPAFQQILYGFPRGEYTAEWLDTPDGVVIPGAYPSDQLIYEVRDRRTWTPYGRSPVEMALLDLDMWMHRIEWLRSEYTDGVMPSGWLINEGNAGSVQWSPAQVLEYEAGLNDVYGGDTSQRRRFRVLPPGIKPDVSPDASEKFKSDYDLHLLKLLVAHFDITVHELGFVEQRGLGSAGHAQEQAKINERRGVDPTLRGIQEILTRISRRHLGMPAELEWRWTSLAGEDEEADKAVAEQVASALLTVNEGRDELGRPRFTFTEADMPAVISTTGIKFLEGSSAAPEPPPGAPQAPHEDPAAPGTPPTPGTPPAGPQAPSAPSAPSAPKAPTAAGGGDAADKAAEAAAYRRWAGKSSNTGRRFQLHHLAGPADLDHHGIDPGRVTFLGKADGPTPGRAAAWPGWSKDEAVAAHYAPRLRSALADIIDARALAAAWLASQRHTPTVKADQPDQAAQQNQPPPPGETDAGRAAVEIGAGVAATAALAFLLHHLGSTGDGAADAVAAQLEPVLADLHAEGAYVGQQAAQAVLDGTTGQWGGWTPGHPETARAALDTTPPPPDPAEIAATRLDEVARAMAAAAADHSTVADLADQIDHVVHGSWADATATTETTRASTDAAVGVYRAARVRATTWLTANDVAVCPYCVENEEHGPVPLGEAFPTGDESPPAHPRCRCCLMPSSANISPQRLGHKPTYERELGEHALPHLSVKSAEHPDHGQGDRNRYRLRDYWLHGEGAAKWATWTELYHHLRNHVPDEEAKRMAAQWYHDRYGFWPGSKKNPHHKDRG